MTSTSTDKIIFIDTWAWLALSNKKDKYHEAAKEEYNDIIKNKLTKLTSDYVLDETITALFRNSLF